MSIRTFIAASLIAGAAVVGLPAVANAQPLDCPRLPYSTVGCDEYLGGKVRAELLTRFGTITPIANTDLGRPVRELCKDGRIVTGDSRLFFIVEQLDVIHGRYCG